MGKASSTASKSRTLHNEHQKLCQYLTIWRTEQFELFPHLWECIGTFDSSQPELEPLLLPLSLSQPFHTRYGLDHLAKIEYSLREGWAHDALDNVQKSIEIFNHNLNFKKTNIHGQ